MLTISKQISSLANLAGAALVSLGPELTPQSPDFKMVCVTPVNGVCDACVCDACVCDA